MGCKFFKLNTLDSVLINGTASAGESVMFISNTGKDQSSLNPLDVRHLQLVEMVLVESIQTFVNDGSTVFHYNNDETQGHIRFILKMLILGYGMAQMQILLKF